MRLRADWLNRVLAVPYVPILGPAHPDQFTAEMFTDVFADILTASRTGTALPFDKDRRWSPRKTDTVLVDEIVHRPDHTIIPTPSRRGSGTVKTFYDGHTPDLDNLRAATRRCCATYSAVNGRVVWFDTAETVDVECTRVLLKSSPTTSLRFRPVNLPWVSWTTAHPRSPPHSARSPTPWPTTGSASSTSAATRDDPTGQCSSGRRPAQSSVRSAD